MILQFYKEWKSIKVMGYKMEKFFVSSSYSLIQDEQNQTMSKEIALARADGR